MWSMSNRTILWNAGMLPIRLYGIYLILPLLPIDLVFDLRMNLSDWRAGPSAQWTTEFGKESFSDVKKEEPVID